MIYANSIDRYCRVAYNEFVLNLFHFYWTSFWYLLPFISLSLLLFVFIQLSSINLKSLSLVVLMLIYFSLINNYNSLNQVLIEILIREESINPLLLNSINKYHPFVFYTSLILLISLTFNNSKQKSKKTNFNYNKFTNLSRSESETYLMLITLTLSWGGWWAAQEGSWGGWWNWDPSEVFGLMLMTIYILKTHINHYLINFRNLKLMINLWLLLFVFMYYLIQLNFDLVSHNFGTRAHQFIDSYGLYISFIVLVLLKICLLFKKNLLKNTSIYAKTSKNTNKLLLFSLLLLAFLIILLSFSELIINLLWTLLSLNFLNNTVGISYLVNLLIYVILIKVYNLNTLNAFVLVCIVNISWIFKIIFISLISIFELSRLHTITWSWVVMSLLNVNQSVSKWDLSLSNNKNLTDYFHLKLSNSGVEHLVITYKDYYLQDTLWGLLRNSSNTTQPVFSHLNNLYNFTQTLKTFLLELSHSINVADYNTNVLPLLIFVWLHYILKTIKLKPRIIF